MKTKIQSLRGVTLVEIAIVLVIIGLLLGGILKGQELINNAKVRAIADRQSSLKVAWFSFIDRFQALPGDYVRAHETIPGATPLNERPATIGNGTIGEIESAYVMQNLTGAGYLRCPQCTYSNGSGTAPAATNSLQNQYGGIMAIFHNVGTYAAIGQNDRPRLMVHTGPRIPSNILAEVDRKLDDGIPTSGDFVFNAYDATQSPNAGTKERTAPGAIQADAGATAGQCMSLQTAPGSPGVIADANDDVWRAPVRNPPVENDCGASVNI